MTGRAAQDSRRWLEGDIAKAACVLWASGHFSTFDIAQLLGAPENAVDRTLRLARDGARAASHAGPIGEAA